MEQIETIECTIEDIIFANEDNGYTVCSIGYDKILSTAVGYLPQIAVGETARLTGKWITHSEYGEQFKVDYFEKVLPKGESAILMYLSSGVIKGVKAATALKIVKTFGDESLNIIRDEPEKLAQIKGISLSKAKEISASFIEKQGVQNIVMFLQPYGITPDMAVKVHKALGADSIDLMKKNPYVLCEYVNGIGFKTADKLARAMGIEDSHPGRIQSGIKFFLGQSAQQSGHVYLPKATLIVQCASALNVSSDLVENNLTALIGQQFITVEKTQESERLYLSQYYNAELGIAKRLLGLGERNLGDVEQKITQGVRSYEEESGISLSQEQKDAVNAAVNNSVFVITGGPGTGKTTIIKAIIRIMTDLGLNVALTAPTGRAAKRMSELCGIEAKTVHRLLEIGFIDSEDEQQFTRDESFPLDCDVVICDEASMMDVFLMHGLLRALKPGTKLVLVGDVDQLPSVGAGNVLKDIISSGAIPVARLTEIYRQAAESMIVINAHRINSGQLPYLNRSDKDFFFMKRDSAQAITDTLIELYCGRLTKTYGFDPLTEIQILTPVRKTNIGVVTLNSQLQSKVNPASSDKKEKEFRDMVFREGDKIMQVKNNYSLAWTRRDETGTGVFNGDIGSIRKIDFTSRTVTVLFDDERMSFYDFNQLEELDLAYAITVHKSQGSEFPCVIMPVYPCAPMLMTRNLFYTAITRAKQLVVLVGRENAIIQMVKNNAETRRFSGLSDKLSAGRTYC